MAALKFAETHNLVAFLEKPDESDGLKQIVDFLNAHTIKYALTINTTIYTSCIEQFWATAKVKTINEEKQLQALVDKKKVIITESTIRRDLHLEDVEGGVKLLLYPRFVQLFVNEQLRDMSHHKRIFVTPSNTKKVFGNMKREGKGFSGRVTPLFQTMMVQAHEDMGKGSEIPTDPHHTPTIAQPSTSQPQKKQPRRKQRKDTEVPQSSGPTEPIADEATNEENVATHSNDPLFSEKEIASLKKRVKKLERKRKSKTLGMKRLFKFGRSAQVVSSEDEGFGAQEDASKQGRKIADIDADVKVTLLDETQGRNDDNLMCDTCVLDEEEVEVEKVVSIAEVTTDSATTTTVDELTLAQTLIEIKVAKPKVRGVMIQEPSEFTTTTTTTTPAASKPSQDKGKEKMIEYEKPLKKKDQIMYDKEAQEQKELTIEEKLRLFVELMDKRKKHFAKLRAE
ncbi:hypothetical protein Tco_0153342 [Tanacetum coccineum]